MDSSDIIRCLQRPFSSSFHHGYYVSHGHFFVVNGGWSDWSVWEQCSLTCGGGFRKRTRLCDSPVPDPYGKNCTGDTEETENCNTSPCPTCSTLKRPFGSLLRCNESNDLNTCTLVCRSGLVFAPGMQPVQQYECGLITNYEWNHLSKGNPIGRLPACTKARAPTSYTAKTTATYEWFPCSSHGDANSQIMKNANSIQCVANQTCNVDLNLESCSTGGSSVRKRSVGTPQATITIKMPLLNSGDLDLENFFQTKTATPALLGLIQTFVEIETSAQQLQNNSKMIFQVSSNGKTYNIQPNSVNTVANLDCPSGSVPTQGLCADCPIGSSYKDDWCARCEVGTYQDETAALLCKQCPVGKTTLGEGADSFADCIDRPLTTISAEATDEIQSKPMDSDDWKRTVIIVCSVLGVCLIIAGAVAARCYIRHSARKKASGSALSLNMIQPENQNGAPRTDSVVPFMEAK